MTKTGDYESLLGMAKGYYLKDGEVLKYNMSLIKLVLNNYLFDPFNNMEYEYAH